MGIIYLEVGGAGGGGRGKKFGCARWRKTLHTTKRVCATVAPCGIRWTCIGRDSLIR